MKTYRVPICFNEYEVAVLVGTEDEINRQLKKTFTAKDFEAHKFSFKTHRGKAYNMLPNHNPIVVVSTDQSDADIVSTLAHEAYHAMCYINDCLTIKDESTEFIAHGIGAIVRGFFIKKNKK